MKKGPLRIILFVALVDLTSFGLIIPLQAVYADRLGASGFTFGLLVSAYAAMQIVFNPLLGRWSDRVGRRPVLLMSIAGSVASHLLLGVADLAQSLPLLFAARILDGITGANIATAQAYIADVTTGEERARGMGLLGAAFGVGFMVGPAFGALLALIGRAVHGPEIGTCWPAFGAAGIAAIAWLIVWRRLPEPARDRDAETSRFQLIGLRRIRAAASNRRVRELLSLAFAANFALVLLESTFVYLCAQRFSLTERGTGLIFAYFGLLIVIVQGGLVGRLARRFGEPTLLAIGPFFTALGFFMFASAARASDMAVAWALLISGTLPTMIGHGLTGPNLNALVSRQADPSKQGATLGVLQGVASLARTASPPIGGLLFDVGAHWPYWVGAVMFMLVGAYAATIARRQSESLRPRR